MEIEAALKLNADLYKSGNAKSTRIRSGVYYQIETNKSSYLDSVTKNNRWVINLGTEM
jgi:hypothetical protein